MSTRSYIGKLNNDGTVRAIYHHWDGGLWHVGKILNEYYTNEETIDKLLDLGDMSLIGTEPEAYWDDKLSLAEKCKTYRARGETGVDAKIYNSMVGYLDNCQEDYTYLFQNGEWLYRTWNNTELKSVAENLDK